jgi:hypothetical protein
MNLAMADIKKTPDAVLTAQGLTLKGVEKIERIRCDASYQDVVLHTWQFGRIVRRDFNLLSYKLFFAVRRDELKRKIRSLLEDVVEEAELLDAMTRRYELDKPSDSTVRMSWTNLRTPRCSTCESFRTSPSDCWKHCRPATRRCRS